MTGYPESRPSTTSRVLRRTPSCSQHPLTSFLPFVRIAHVSFLLCVLSICLVPRPYPSAHSSGLDPSRTFRLFRSLHALPFPLALCIALCITIPLHRSTYPFAPLVPISQHSSARLSTRFAYPATPPTRYRALIIPPIPSPHESFCSLSRYFTLCRVHHR